MRHILIFICILNASVIHAQQKRIWVVEAGTNISWAVKKNEIPTGLLHMRPLSGGSAGVLIQYLLLDNFSLETGIRYALTRYRYYISDLGKNSIKGTGFNNGILAPILLGSYNKNISKKLSLTLGGGTAIDFFRPDGELIFIVGINDSVYSVSNFNYTNSINFYLIGNIGLLQKKDGIKKIELQVSFHQGLINGEKAIIQVFYSNGSQLGKAKFINYGSYLSLQFRYYLRKKQIELPHK